MDENKKKEKEDKYEKYKEEFRQNQLSIIRKGLNTIKKPPRADAKTTQVMINLIRMVRKLK